MSKILASEIKVLFFVPALALALGLFAAQTGYSADAGLMGTVESSDGNALDGVTVSARSSDKTYTTTVFTDEAGKYFFPPLAEGNYRIWAQAVGFETARAEQTLDAAARAQQDFEMKPLADFSMQLSGTEWMAALPEDTPQHRRMKAIFRNNCSGCHTPSLVLQNRFDEAGWRSIITLMEKVGIYGNPPRPDGAPFPFLRAFKDELAAYLAEMRGPGPSPMKFKPFPRPRGEAAQVVITEYDITSSSNTDEYVTHDGSDWMEGTPSAYEARGPHDAEVDPDGFVWIADSQIDRVRTVARLDPKTGEVKNFKLEARHGVAMRSHGIIIDGDGIAWFNANGGLGKINTRTEKIEYFEPPRGMARVGGTIDTGTDGIIWTSSSAGALAFNPETNEFTEFKSIQRGRQGRTYGVAVDAENNGWWAQMNYDTVGKGNLRTGETTEVVFEPFEHGKDAVSAADRAVYELTGGDWNSAPPWQQAPRRLGGDKTGNVWVALWWGDRLAKIDIQTHQVTYYPYPNPGFAGVYDTSVDRNGMVWMNLLHADRIARFDPATEQWTEFQLPSLGAETRHISVDNRKDPVEVWTPYWRTSKMTRLQFRTKAQLQALARP
ncbi:MAG: carboxypeptidase regulatory-like domain-containing protein [Acidobacteria bacterium]|nr:carboxypeptidase regulatory-like domain-containing protein [Acidobacteriota bacterium]